MRRHAALCAVGLPSIATSIKLMRKAWPSSQEHSHGATIRREAWTTIAISVDLTDADAFEALLEGSLWRKSPERDRRYQ